MGIWKRLSFRKKTALSLGLVFVVMASALGLSIFGANKIAKDYDHAIHVEMEMRDTLRQVNSEMLMARRHEKDFLLRGKKKYLERHEKTVAALKSKISSLKGKNVKVVSNDDVAKLLKAVGHYQQGFKDVVKTIQMEGDSKNGYRGDLRKVAHNIEGLIKTHSLGPEATVELLMLRRHEKDYLLRRTAKYHDKINKRLETIKSLTMELTEDAAILAAMEKELATYKTGAQNIVNNDKNRKDIIASFRADIHSIEKITKKDIKSVTTDIGALVTKLNTFRDMIVTSMLVSAVVGLSILLLVMLYYFNVSKVIATLTDNLKRTSGETTEGSHELKDTADGLSSSVSEQSAAILETVSTLDEIREMMKKSVDNAKFSEEKATHSHGVASDGKMAVSEVVSAINDINECNGDITSQMEKTSNELEQIVQVIKEISDKTKVINDIVFQTKLLSFNASVEAARAGEHGKGFAVVAEEVGNLATMSGNASNEIEELLSNSVNRVEAIVSDSKSAVESLVKTAKGKTEYGVETANKCNEVLDSVVDNVGQVKDLMREIAAASSEQATGIENISQAMNELDESTHINTNLANNTAVNSAQMAKQAGDLDDIVNSLEGIINGLKKGAVASPVALDNVVDINSKKASVEKDIVDEPLGTTEAEAEDVKMVVGSSVPDLPSRDDDRFEDV
jgi:methyl-accepting chemotaxis protein